MQLPCPSTADHQPLTPRRKPWPKAPTSMLCCCSGGPVQIRTEGRPVGTHQGLVARMRGPRRCYGARQPIVRRSGAVPTPRGHPLARLARAVWGLPGGTPAPFAVEQVRRLGTRLQDPVARPGQRVRDDRLEHRTSPPAQLRGKRGALEKQAIGRIRGGLSTKIHTTVDALGKPTGFHLTPGQAHDLEGADVLLRDTAPKRSWPTRPTTRRLG
jgi:hypothetical protein